MSFKILCSKLKAYIVVVFFFFTFKIINFEYDNENVTFTSFPTGKKSYVQFKLIHYLHSDSLSHVSRLL